MDPAVMLSSSLATVSGSRKKLSADVSLSFVPRRHRDYSDDAESERRNNNPQHQQLPTPNTGDRSQ